MYSIDAILSIDMSDFMERMGFEKSFGNKYICPLCESGTRDNQSGFKVFNDNMFKCFSCGKFGNTIHFMMAWKEISKGEAIKELAGIYGFEKIDTKKYKSVTYQVFDEVRTFYKIEDARKWENKILDKSHKDITRDCRVIIAHLAGHEIIPESHWLFKCLSPRFNPNPTALGMIIDRVNILLSDNPGITSWDEVRYGDLSERLGLVADLRLALNSVPDVSKIIDRVRGFDGL